MDICQYIQEHALTAEKLRQIAELNELASKRGQSLAQMALSWVLRDGIKKFTPKKRVCLYFFSLFGIVCLMD